jgi:hypothetical protein
MRNSLIALAGAPTLSPALELALSAPRRLAPQSSLVHGSARTSTTGSAELAGAWQAAHTEGWLRIVPARDACAHRRPREPTAAFSIRATGADATASYL